MRSRPGLADIDIFSCIHRAPAVCSSSWWKVVRMPSSYDAIVIGAGQAGPSLAKRLSNAGMKVAFVERHKFGGTCVNTGCTPTKAMVASAYAALLARRGAEYGVNIAGEISVNMKNVKARKDAIVDASASGVEAGLRGNSNITVHVGHARFQSATEVSVAGNLLTAPKIFINVGCRAIVPDMPGINQISYLTSSSMMDVDFLPRHLVVVGRGYIGLEFGQMFRRFGSEVTIIEMAPRLIKREDPDISQAILEIVENEGIQVRLNATCIAFRKSGNDIAAGVDCEEGSPEVIGSHVLLAIGRRPNTDDLGLEKAGGALDKHGYVIVDDQLRTNVPVIWALGDRNGRSAFTHNSYHDYDISAANPLADHPP